MDQSDPSVSWALCPQDPAWHIEGSPEESRRQADGLQTAQDQILVSLELAIELALNSEEIYSTSLYLPSAGSKAFVTTAS
uniref:zinc finger protein 606 isoform c n=1 Tax=Rattus norvegicus TaxID=10116 RepID=UPI00349E8A4F